MKIPLSSYSNYVEITNTLCCLYGMFIKSAGGIASEQAVPGLWGLGVCYNIILPNCQQDTTLKICFTILKNGQVVSTREKKDTKKSNSL